MCINYEKKKNLLDIIKLFLTVILLLIAIYINYFSLNFYLNVFFKIFLYISIIYIIFTTNNGKLCLSFFKKSQREMKKITWPSYQETCYISLIVLFFTIVMTLILWLLDSIIIYVISFITNSRM